jgi:hypothetical protein
MIDKLTCFRRRFNDTTFNAEALPMKRGAD